MAKQNTSEPRWLTADEHRTWVRLLALVTRLPAELDARLQREHGLTLFEYSVLAVLSEQPKRTMRMSDLAFLSHGSPSRLTHVADKLERAGLLRRARSSEDRRYTNATLTPAGLRRVVAAAPDHLSAARELVIDNLTREQRRALRDIADGVLTAIDPDHAWPAHLR